MTDTINPINIILTFIHQINDDSPNTILKSKICDLEIENNPILDNNIVRNLLSTSESYLILLKDKYFSFPRNILLKYFQSKNILYFKYSQRNDILTLADAVNYYIRYGDSLEKRKIAIFFRISRLKTILFNENNIEPDTLYKKLYFSREDLFIQFEFYLLKKIEYKLKAVSQVAERLGASKINIFYQSESVNENLIKMGITAESSNIGGSNREKHEAQKSVHLTFKYNHSNHTVNLNRNYIEKIISEENNFIISYDEFKTDIDLKYLIDTRCISMVEVYNTNIVFSNFSEFERKLFLKAQTFGLELNTNSKKIENININVDIHFIDIFKNTDCITGYNLYIGKEGFFHLIKIIEIEKQLFNSCQPFSKLICFIKANLEYDFETYKKQIDSFYMLHNNSFRIQNSEQLIKHTNKLFNNYFSETEVCEYLNIYFGNNLNWYIFRNLSFLVCGASNSELEEFFEKPTYWKSPLFPFYLTIYQHNMITMMKRRIITALDMFLNKKISEFMDFSIPEEKYISIYPNKDGKGCNLDILTMDFTQCSDKSDVVTKNTILNSASNIFDLNTNITRPKKVGCSSVRNIMLAMFSNTVGLKQKIINCLKKIIIDAYYFEYSSKRLKIDIEYGLEKEYIFLKSLTHSYISEKFGLRSDYSGTCALILFMTFLIFCVIEETHDNPTYDCNYDRGLFITRLLNDYYQYQSNYNYKKFSIIHVYNVFKSYDSYLSKNEDAYNYYFHLFIDTELKFTKFNNKHMYFSLEDFNKIKDTISQTISENSGDFDNNLNLIANKSSNSSNNSSPKKDELNSGGVYSDVSKMVSMSSNHMVNDSIMSVDSD